MTAQSANKIDLTSPGDREILFYKKSYSIRDNLQPFAHNMNNKSRNYKFITKLPAIRPSKIPQVSKKQTSKSEAWLLCSLLHFQIFCDVFSRLNDFAQKFAVWCNDRANVLDNLSPSKPFLLSASLGFHKTKKLSGDKQKSFIFTMEINQSLNMKQKPFSDLTPNA